MSQSSKCKAIKESGWQHDGRLNDETSGEGHSWPKSCCDKVLLCWSKLSVYDRRHQSFSHANWLYYPGVGECWVSRILVAQIGKFFSDLSLFGWACCSFLSHFQRESQRETTILCIEMARDTFCGSKGNLTKCIASDDATCSSIRIFMQPLVADIFQCGPKW